MVEQGRWLKISLSTKQVAAGAIDEIQQECFAFFAAAGLPKDGLLLSRRTMPGSRKEAAVELYLSPVMAHLCRAVAAKHLAVTTERPPTEGTATLLSSGAPDGKAPSSH